MWLRKILEELHLKQVGATTIFCDNNLVIKLSNNPVKMQAYWYEVLLLWDLRNNGTIDLK